VQRLPQILFAVACIVNIGGIEEIDAGVERRVNHALRGRSVDSPSEIITAEPNQRNFQRTYASFFHYDCPVLFSKRFHWDLRPNRLSELLARKRREGVSVLDLTESNPTRAAFHYPLDVMAAFEDSRMLAYEPLPKGSLRAREAVAEYYSSRGHSVSPDRILLTASTSEAYSYLFKLLADPGDRVLVPRPSYPLFEYLAAMEFVCVERYSLHYHSGWSMDIDAMPQGARAIVLVNPNNPTGSFVKHGKLERLAKIGAPLISDEVFADYAFAPDADRVTTLVDVDECLAFSMSGLSKIAGLPQMKLGWIVVSGPEPQRREALEKLEWIADTYLSVSAPVQYAAPRLLRAGEEVQRQIRERTAKNLQFAHETLAGSAASVLDVEGGWYATLRMPRIRSEEEWILELLERENVLVQPGFFYDFETEAFLIVSLLTEPGPFREGMARLKRL
jgi:alanine-synthesizing transaminase